MHNLKTPFCEERGFFWGCDLHLMNDSKRQQIPGGWVRLFTRRL
ncbi:hypothetical protein PSPPH_1215 [Pseudomonas savastanoi pv. phaseolicola 1448A]|uniref:Uncharacterized protein n=3 Tax=Pseudomonas savastanoi TaxID=29438 RepID=A0A3M4MT51_PSESG|nr:hypothetical protein PSPPH_1215 [Pseudomonas savastanoi pv. phaseolicola 1448A]KPB35251.1 Uncharacterized protein AC515_4791 [Pseudomonas savastanoi pv. phaseolicola]KPB61733.1 Uncharacterized protein AC508_5164 [Pseudomonas amygdali pv. mellea]KPB87800.1 Uncharacterized protein AC504_4783 [Pseudomonas syringae pv. maculicola]RMM70412.1 hypothetical protein ALQ73_101415 [Pseudomonas savastanoi pv. glycinea]